jgi:hypothetical protein
MERSRFLGGLLHANQLLTSAQKSKNVTRYKISMTYGMIHLQNNLTLPSNSLFFLKNRDEYQSK